jgi:hypothetical protein
MLLIASSSASSNEIEDDEEEQKAAKRVLSECLLDILFRRQLKPQGNYACWIMRR